MRLYRHISRYNDINIIESGVNITSIVDDIMFENTKQLLRLYRPVSHSVNKRYSELDDDCALSHNCSLRTLINELVECRTDIKRFEQIILSIDKSLCLMEIMERTLVSIRDFLPDGKVYYNILKSYYFDNFVYTHSDVAELEKISEATYYRKYPKAIKCYAAHLWGFVIPQYNAQAGNKLKTRKKSESRMRVN